jgi:hypothetical protein
MKEENKLCLFVDSIEEDIGLQSKKIHTVNTVKLASLSTNGSYQRVQRVGAISKAQAVQFNKLLGKDEI